MPRDGLTKGQRSLITYTLQSVLLDVHGEVRSKFADLKLLLESEMIAFSRNWNANRPINRLPHELLSEIIVHLSLQDRCNAVQVCQQWHSTLFAATMLWTDISLKITEMSPQSAFIVTNLVKRSRNAPLRLSLNLDNRFAKALYAPSEYLTLRDELCRAMRRITVFKLRTPGLVKHWYWTHILSCDAPRLRELYLSEVEWRDMALSERQLRPMMLSATPNLQHLYLHGLVLNRASDPHEAVAQSHPLASLTQLGLPVADVDTVRDALACFPQLSVLTMVASVYDMDTNLVETDVDIPEPLEHNLQRLRIGGHPGAADMLAHFHSIPERYASFWRKESAPWELANILAQQPTFYDLSISWAYVQALEGESYLADIAVDGRRVAVDVLSDQVPAALRCIPAAARLDELTSLRVPTDLWFMVAQHARYAALAELTLVVAADQLWDDSDPFNIVECPVALPALRTINFEQELCPTDAQQGPVRPRYVLETAVIDAVKSLVPLENLPRISLVLRGGLSISTDTGYLASMLLSVATDESAHPYTVAQDDPWYCFYLTEDTMFL
ncbi:hypothetical protein BKA62DRAFT_769028 [Auriculariales sp. MPI-PUGE-AT-0066]|nr:hypothetical protein BKA62DRAFT_769028 [Auriculariales sp. MPI-PUGE-AT-0066]